jgi:hypothetical protein
MNQVRAWIDEQFKGDPIIWAIVILLSILSILVVYSATGTLVYQEKDVDTEQYLFKHSKLVLASLVVMWLAHKIPYRKYALYARLFMFLSIPLLLITYLYGSTINEANRWLVIPVINQTFQHQGSDWNSTSYHHFHWDHQCFDWNGQYVHGNFTPDHLLVDHVYWPGTYAAPCFSGDGRDYRTFCCHDDRPTKRHLYDEN